MFKWKNFTLKKIYNCIIECFIWACGSSLLVNFFLIAKPATINEIRSEVATFFFIYVMFNFLYILLLEKTPTVVNAEDNLEVAKRITSNNADIAEYNLNIDRVHEAGHALMSYLQGVQTFDVNVSYLSSYVSTTIYKNWNIQDIKGRIIIAYAGAAAEEIILGEFHYGCMGPGGKSDFRVAEDLIRAYILLNDPSGSKVVLESEKGQDIISLSKEFYHESKELLLKHMQELDLLINKLKSKSTLNEIDVNEIMSLQGKNHGSKLTLFPT